VSLLEKQKKPKGSDEGSFLILIVLFSLFASAATVTTGSFNGPSVLPFLAALALSFFSGATVGMSEIISRYRDEPIRACRSFYGLCYIYLNALLGVFAVLLIWQYPSKFGFTIYPPDPVLSGILGGFGASAVMITRLMVLKGADIVIKYLLSMVDQYVDRDRAAYRYDLVFNSLPEFLKLGTALGSFKSVADYLLTSLLALQNLEEDRKKQLENIFIEYDQQPLPPPVKYLAMGFVFLTIVGESRYNAIVNNASSGLVAAGIVPPPAPGLAASLPSAH
jgi:succinate dehydrogenase hydrophobic anchor subunit